MAPPGPIEVESVTDTTGVTNPDPFSLPVRTNEICGRRRKTEKSQWGVAAPASSANFKSNNSFKSKPKAKRWDRELGILVQVK
jgi:aromatic amino acid aminotransferase I